MPAGGHDYAPVDGVGDVGGLVAYRVADLLAAGQHVRRSGSLLRPGCLPGWPQRRCPYISAPARSPARRPGMRSGSADAADRSDGVGEFSRSRNSTVQHRRRRPQHVRPAHRLAQQARQSPERQHRGTRRRAPVHRLAPRQGRPLRRQALRVPGKGPELRRGTRALRARRPQDHPHPAQRRRRALPPRGRSGRLLAPLDSSRPAQIIRTGGDSPSDSLRPSRTVQSYMACRLPTLVSRGGRRSRV